MALLGALVPAAMIAVTLFADAGTAAGAPAKRTIWVYSAQFNCGLMPQDGVPLDPLTPQREFPRELPAKPANYATDINVHNPQLTTAVLAKKAVLTGWVSSAQAGATGVVTSEPEQQFKGGQTIPVRLGPDGAFEIDCADIVHTLAPPGFTPAMSFIKGFVVIYSRSEIDVVASYTSERVGSTTIHCLHSDGTVDAAVATAVGLSCGFKQDGAATAIGIAADNTGTGLTLDTEAITPKVLPAGVIVPGL